MNNEIYSACVAYFHGRVDGNDEAAIMELDQLGLPWTEKCKEFYNRGVSDYTNLDEDDELLHSVNWDIHNMYNQVN